MAHNIHLNEQTGQHSFFSVKEKAWHGLGQIVQDYPTSAEAIQFAGLDYEVVKQDIYTTCYNAEGQAMDFTNRIKSHHATMRPDTGEVLGVVGKDYEIIQNRDAFSFFDSIVGGNGIQYETAGALGKGERIFITAKLPGYIKVGREDLIEQYLFLTTSHDGYGSITAAFTPVRIVCNNTLNAALRNFSNAIKIRHTANAKDRLEQAHKVMGISNQLSVQLEQLFNQWTKVKITDPQLQQLIRLALVPNKEVLDDIQNCRWDELSTNFNNICNSVFEYAQTSPTQQTETTKGNLFGAYNAVTGYFQNVRHYRDGEAKLKSLLYGGTAQLRTQKAFNLCVSAFQGDLTSVLN
jgi:phage/plasmid-like protein (TIGR03299 family)